MAVPALISEVALCLFGNMCLSFLQALQSALCTYNAKETKLVKFQVAVPSFYWSKLFWVSQKHFGMNQNFLDIGKKAK